MEWPGKELIVRRGPPNAACCNFSTRGFVHVWMLHRPGGWKHMSRVRSHSPTGIAGSVSQQKGLRGIKFDITVPPAPQTVSFTKNPKGKEPLAPSAWWGRQDSGSRKNKKGNKHIRISVVWGHFHCCAIVVAELLSERFAVGVYNFLKCIQVYQYGMFK